MSAKSNTETSLRQGVGRWSFLNVELGTESRGFQEGRSLDRPKGSNPFAFSISPPAPTLAEPFDLSRYPRREGDGGEARASAKRQRMIGRGNALHSNAAPHAAGGDHFDSGLPVTARLRDYMTNAQPAVIPIQFDSGGVDGHARRRALQRLGLRRPRSEPQTDSRYQARPAANLSSASENENREPAHSRLPACSLECMQDNAAALSPFDSGLATRGEYGTPESKGDAPAVNPLRRPSSASQHGYNSSNRGCPLPVFAWCEVPAHLFDQRSADRVGKSGLWRLTPAVVSEKMHGTKRQQSAWRNVKTLGAVIGGTVERDDGDIISEKWVRPQIYNQAIKHYLRLGYNAGSNPAALTLCDL